MEDAGGVHGHVQGRRQVEGCAGSIGVSAGTVWGSEWCREICEVQIGPKGVDKDMCGGCQGKGVQVNEGCEERVCRGAGQVTEERQQGGHRVQGYVALLA